MSASVYIPPPRRFVPQDLKLQAFGDIEPLFAELRDRPVDSRAALEQWLADASELYAVVDETANRRYIDKSCHTDDAAIESAYLDFVEKIEPNIKPAFFALQRKLISSPHLAALVAADRRYAVLERSARAEVELFRDENVPLETESKKLVNEYDKLFAAMAVTIDGKELTLQQAHRYLEEPDRGKREEAFVKTVERRMRDAEAVASIFDQLLELRQRIALNAGMSDFRAYQWKAYKRFDYSPDDCLRFAESIEKVCVPLVKELDRQRSEDLKIAPLRPWDFHVDPLSRPPLRPFAEDDTDTLVAKTQAIFDRLSPALAEDFRSLGLHGNLDLGGRKGKQPGGYQANLHESRQPFIFMNAAGMQRDVEILLHEAGHAFHMLAASRNEPLVFLREPGIEFCEVASMSMELFAADHLDVFYDDQASPARARRRHLESIVGLLPSIAVVDSFQHWLYTHPGHSRAERDATWVSLTGRFWGDVDWTGFEAARATSWHRTLHLFQVPFYYVEYGIAQLGALQMWLKARENPQQALANYRAALALGGTRPLPELFAAAGIRFDFSEQTLRPLMNAVREELDSLPR